jgi:hypothetical protein
MSRYEDLRDSFIHDHPRSVTQHLHFVFEAAENRIAELEAENKQVVSHDEEMHRLFLEERKRAEQSEARVRELEAKYEPQ